MTGLITALWRHPIKSLGRETLTRTQLSAGQAMPWDRHWAVLHDLAPHDGNAWGPCQNFMIGTRVPSLAGVWATLDEATATVTLRHQRLGSHSFCPDDAGATAAFFAWLAPILPEDRAQPRRIVSAGSRGMTDSDFPSVSIMNMSSHRSVAQRLGRSLEPERWRGNLWFDGLAPWEEFDWIGRRVRIGSAVLQIRDRIERCMHTTANPVTGLRDTDVLGALETGWDHRDFGVYGEVIEDGTVATGDQIEVL